MVDNNNGVGFKRSETEIKVNKILFGTLITHRHTHTVTDHENLKAGASP